MCRDFRDVGIQGFRVDTVWDGGVDGFTDREAEIGKGPGAPCHINFDTPSPHPPEHAGVDPLKNHAPGPCTRIPQRYRDDCRTTTTMQISPKPESLLYIVNQSYKHYTICALLGSPSLTGRRDSGLHVGDCALHMSVRDVSWSKH